MLWLIDRVNRQTDIASMYSVAKSSSWLLMVTQGRISSDYSVPEYVLDKSSWREVQNLDT